MPLTSNLKLMLDVLESHTKTLGVFLNGIESAKNNGADHAAALSAIKAGASAMHSETETSGWMWAARYRLMDLARIRLALEGFIAAPETALKSIGGRPIGFGTAQLWTDMAIEIVKGDWEEARQRRKMSPAELVLFATGPLGLVALIATRGEDTVPDVAEALGLEDEYQHLRGELETAKQGAERAAFWLKVGAGVVTVGAVVAGTATIVRTIRGSN